MATQNTTSQAAKLTLTAAFRLVPLILSGDPLSKAAGHLNHFVCALTCALLKFAPSIILAWLPYSRKLHFGSPAAFPMRPNLAVIQPTAAFHLGAA